MEAFFVGADNPQVLLLKGDWGSEESVQELFEGATWHFRLDGTFAFSRGAVANFREYAIEGLYTLIDNSIEFHGEAGATSLDAFLLFQGRVIQLQALYALQGKKVARIVQMLSPQPQAPGHPARATISGFPIPSSYRFTLSGQVDANPFGPLPGTLDLLPATGKDPGPFLVQLTTDSKTDPGQLFWTSFIHFIDGTGTQESTIALISGGQARLKVVPDHSLMGPSWTAMSREETIQGQAGPITTMMGGLSLPVTAERGTLTLTVLSGRLSGTVHATGKSTLDQSSIYTAQFSGVEQETPVRASR